MSSLKGTPLQQAESADACLYDRPRETTRQVHYSPRRSTRQVHYPVAWKPPAKSTTRPHASPSDDIPVCPLRHHHNHIHSSLPPRHSFALTVALHPEVSRGAARGGADAVRGPREAKNLRRRRGPHSRSFAREPPAHDRRRRLVPRRSGWRCAGGSRASLDARVVPHIAAGSRGTAAGAGRHAADRPDRLASVLPVTSSRTIVPTTAPDTPRSAPTPPP
jgi:hypothetical protein